MFGAPLLEIAILREDGIDELIQGVVRWFADDRGVREECLVILFVEARDVADRVFLPSARLDRRHVSPPCEAGMRDARFELCFSTVTAGGSGQVCSPRASSGPERPLTAGSPRGSGGDPKRGVAPAPKTGVPGTPSQQRFAGSRGVRVRLVGASRCGGVRCGGRDDSVVTPRRRCGLTRASGFAEAMRRTGLPLCLPRVGV
jgi:hypothetical protein